MNNKMNKMNTSMDMKKCNNIYKDIRKYSTYANSTWDKERLNFDFSAFYEKYNTHLPNNNIPSENFLTWLVGFTEGEGSFIVNNRGDLAICYLHKLQRDKQILEFIQETLRIW